MSVDELEKALTALSREDRARLIARMEEIDAAEVDAKIERDAKNGTLDRYAEEALADVKAGRFRKL